MTILFFLLLLGAAICFGLAAFSTRGFRFNLVALGLLLWVIVPLVKTLTAL